MSDKKITKEPQYNALFEAVENDSPFELGLMANHTWATDPKRNLFTLSRYKFVSRMFDGYSSVLEVGCADSYGTRLVQQTVKNVTAVDFDPVFIEDSERRLDKRWPLTLKVHDILTDGPVEKENFDGAYALDVLEHIEEEEENTFLQNMCDSLNAGGSAIIGMPSLQSQEYASKQSKEGHVNCKTGDGLKMTMLKHFNSVFIFSMNDEVLHTGFHPMSHYLLALCSNKKLS